MKWRHLQHLPLIVGALVLIGCTGRWLHHDYVWIAPVAALASALLRSSRGSQPPATAGPAAGHTATASCGKGIPCQLQQPLAVGVRIARPCRV